MKISDILDFEEVVNLSKSLDVKKELRIERNSEATDSESLYFLYGKVGGDGSVKAPFFKKPPYAIVCDDSFKESTDIPLIRVKNTRRTLSFSYSAECNIDYSSLNIIGITGTNGKSSTAEITYRLLREGGEGVGFIGTGKIMINDLTQTEPFYSMTTPDPELLYPTLKKMQTDGCKYIVMEVSSHALALSKVAPIKFKCSLFTNLSEEHRDFHNDMEEYYKTKLSLFKQSEIGIFNLDDRYSERAYREASCKKYSVGIIKKGDASIVDYQSYGLSGASYFYKENGLIFKSELKLPGAHNVYNSLMSTKCLLSLGTPAKTIKNALPKITRIPGRYELIDDEVKVIIDYAHTPLAMENVLYSLYSYKNAEQKLVVLFGCGGERDKHKRASMGACAEKYADSIILTEDNSRSENLSSIIEDISRGISDKAKTRVIQDRKEAINTALLTADKNDIIVILGKGHEQYIIDSFGYHNFNEKEIIQKALSERRKRNENKA